MNLTELQLKARVRTSWQALDLGVKMARRWYLSLMLAWLIPALVVYLLLVAGMYAYGVWSVSPLPLSFSVLWKVSPLWLLLIIWWLKPLLDRLPLFLLSHYIFNDKARGWFHWRALLRLYRFDALLSLSVRRFDIQRSLHLPVTVLERQKGGARKRRCEFLRRSCGPAGGWLTLVMMCLEGALSLGLAILLLSLLGINFYIQPTFLMKGSDIALLYLEILPDIFFMALIAPFYIACGFSLYLNRRIELEAWDLELVFRESARRRESQSTIKPLLSAALSLLMLCLVTPLSISPAQAQEPTLTREQLDARDQVRTILETPPFVIEKNVSHWQWQDEPDQVDSEDSSSLDRLNNLMDEDSADLSLLFSVVELLLWIGMGLLVVLVLRKLVSHLKAAPVMSKPNARGSVNSPQVMMGMAISAESLPEQIDARIDEAFERGDERQAMSLMYRHVLFLLIHQHRVPVEPWYTELECADAVKQRSQLPLDGCWDELTQYWVQLAYAHQSPPRARVQHLYLALKKVLAP